MRVTISGLAGRNMMLDDPWHFASSAPLEAHRKDGSFMLANDPEIDQEAAAMIWGRVSHRCGRGERWTLEGTRRAVEWLARCLANGGEAMVSGSDDPMAQREGRAALRDSRRILEILDRDSGAS